LGKGKPVKKFTSKEAYRKFLAYTHIRTPSGKRAKSHSQSISGRTPTARKEKTVKVAGRLHTPRLSPSRTPSRITPHRGR
jgi:hypothetical protein